MSKFVPPTIDQYRSIAEKHFLHISEDDLQQYLEFGGSPVWKVYEEIDKLPDQCLPVKYRFRAQYPEPEDNPLNAWAWLTKVDGAADGKLAGKVIAVKNNVSMAGVPMKIGSQFMEGYTPNFNAVIVDRILDAGGAINGASTCEDMCFSGSSFTSHPAPVLNPHNKARSAGGSSSGSAALVAAGTVDMAIGTDQGGSIRLPACWCGIVGLKPTRGLVPYTGLASLDAILDHCGPMARTVKDCALLLEVIAGSDGGLDHRQAAGSLVKDYTSALTGDVKELRIGILKEGFEGCESDVSELVMKAVNKLSSVGGKVEEFSSNLQQRARALGIVLVSEGTYATYRNGGVSPPNTLGFKDVIAHNFLFKAPPTRADFLPISFKSLLLFDGYISAQYGQHYYAKAVNSLRPVVAAFDEEIFSKYDVIVMPTIKYKPVKLPETPYSVTEYLNENIRNTSNTIAYNATGHPAVNVNVGFSEGLPVGMMIVGRHWEDDVVLKVAHAVEQLRE